MASSTIKNKRIGYKISMYFSFQDGTVINVPKITKLSKRCAFDKNFFPIWEVECVMDYRYLTKLKNNQDSIYAVIKFIRVDYDGFEYAAEVCEEFLYNEVMIPMFDQDSFNVPINTTMREESNNFLTGSGMPQIHLKFMMYSLNGLILTRKMYNYIFDNADVATVIKYLCDNKKTNGKDGQEGTKEISGWICDQPDNTTVYKDIVVVPHNFVAAIKDLQIRYGIFINGLIVYYDKGIVYILNKYSLSHEISEDQFDTIELKCKISSPTTYNGISVYFPGEKDVTNPVYVFGSRLDHVDNDVALAELIGNKTIFSSITLTTNFIEYLNGEVSDVDDPYTTIDGDAPHHSLLGKKIIPDYDELNNPYNYTSSMKNASHGVDIVIPVISGVCFDDFKPNQIFNINVTDDANVAELYNGNYSIHDVMFVFQPDSDLSNNFVCDATNISLTRVSKE